MEAVFLKKRRAYFVIGSIGIFWGVSYLALSFQLPFGKIDQPGAGVFPVIVGVIMIFASLATIWEGRQTEKNKHVEFPIGADRKRLLILIGLLFVYFVALPWLGFLISSLLFCMLLIRVLSNLGWSRNLAYSLAMSLALYIVFILFFKVPLPLGILRF